MTSLMGLDRGATGDAYGAAVSLQGTNAPYPYPPIQGNWFVFIQGAYGNGGSAAIGQTGQIPATALSVIFWGRDSNMQITFAGQPLAFSVLGSTANYNIYGANISAFSGQTGQLLFTGPDGSSGPYAPYGSGGFIDNIQFSSSAVPEPSELALAALGTLLLGCRRWRKTSQTKL